MAGVTMKKPSESSCVLLLLTLLRYLHLLLCNMALALVNKMRIYWNVIKVDLPTYVHYVSLVFTFANLLVQQLVAVTAQHYGHESRYAFAAFAAACFHLLGAGCAYIKNKDKLQMFSSFIALILLGLAGFSITFERDTTWPAFLLCQLLQFVFRLSGLIRKYYLLLDGVTVPLSLVSTGDPRIKFKVSEEDSHLLKLGPSSWLKVREDYAHILQFEPNVCHEVILSVFSKEDNIFKFTLKNYEEEVFKSMEEP